jgi:hypothetical protein
MKRLVLAALALTLPVNVANAQDRFEFRRAELVQSEFSTDVQVEILAHKLTAIIFLRLLCELKDANGKLLGVSSKDISSGIPYRTAYLLPEHFYRPVVHVPHVANADHAVCRFATKDDSLPLISNDDVSIVLDSTREVHITNRSSYHVDKVGFECRGPQTTRSYEAGGLGWSPGYTSPRQRLEAVADSCTVLWATASPAVDPLN